MMQKNTTFTTIFRVKNATHYDMQKKTNFPLKIV
jgi:hypothetical protein